MRRRKKKSHVKLTVTLLTMTIVIILIVVAVAINQANQTPQKKPPANQYLRVEHTKSLGRYDTYTGQFKMLNTLGLNITAVGGDAHNITVYQDTATDNPVIANISKGKSDETQITVDCPLEDEDGDGLYEVWIEIECTEAEIAPVKLLLDPQDIVFPGG